MENKFKGLNRSSLKEDKEDKLELSFDVNWWKVGFIGLLLLVITSVLVYVFIVRNQVWFAFTRPSVVKSCENAYAKEYKAAEDRFKFRIENELVSPLPEDEVKKVLPQEL